MPRRPTQESSPAVSSAHSSTLDARALEAVGRFVRVLARCGCTREDIAQEVLNACREIPKSWAQSAQTAVSEMDAAAHVLTLWFSDPASLDRCGNPLPLPLRGAERSLEALAQRVDPKLDVQEILRHLMRRSVLRRIGRRYVPRDRVLSFRGSGAPYHARSLRTLVAMLSTLEHNGRPRRSTPGWYEVFAVNPRFPIDRRPAFDGWLRHQGNRFLFQADAKMLGSERARKKGERTVRLGVGLYRFEEEPSAAERRVKPSGRRRK